jgi:hypothetical protein
VGTIKRLPRTLIIPRQLYRWTVVKILSIRLQYCTVEDNSKEITKLEERFRKAKTLLGTQNIQCAIPA